MILSYSIYRNQKLPAATHPQKAVCSLASIPQASLEATTAVSKLTTTSDCKAVRGRAKSACLIRRGRILLRGLYSQMARGVKLNIASGNFHARVNLNKHIGNGWKWVLRACQACGWYVLGPRQTTSQGHAETRCGAIQPLQCRKLKQKERKYTPHHTNVLWIPLSGLK